MMDPKHALRLPHKRAKARVSEAGDLEIYIIQFRNVSSLHYLPQLVRSR